jgi:hypothetical protein
MNGISISRGCSERVRLTPVVFVLVALALPFLSGCATVQPTYFWGSYQQAVWNRLVENNDEAALEQLHETLLASDKQPLPLGPGIRPELAYLLYQQGKHAQAVSLLEAEASAFPESEFLMSRITTEIARRQSNSAAIKGDR